MLARPLPFLLFFLAGGPDSPASQRFTTVFKRIRGDASKEDVAEAFHEAKEIFKGIP